MPKRVFGGLVATLIAVAVCAVVVDRPASASALPDLSSPSVALPELPSAPSLPSPPPLPPAEPPSLPIPAPVPSPSIPVPVPPSAALPAPAQRPVLPLPAAEVVEIAGAITQQASDLVPAGASAMQAAARGGNRSRGAPSRRSSRVHAMPYRKRLRIVRALRGCLDRLPERQSDALILRYGIGDLGRQPARQAADALRVSLERFRLIHRRGLRNLVKEARGGSCENGGIAAETMAPAYTAAWPATVNAATTTPAALRGAARERGAVLGVERSSDDEHPSGANGGDEARGPRAATLFGGVPLETGGALFIALLAIMLAGATWIILSFARALR